MTPVEELREAARLMRERSEAATPGPWIASEDTCARPKQDGPLGCHTWHGWNVGCDDEMGNRADVMFESDAVHIASWHPAVALAVADWLEDEAEITERAMQEVPSLAAAWVRQSLAVARAYLGRES